LAEGLFWAALGAYAAASLAYAGGYRSEGRLGRVGTWAVRLGWLVQTALLCVQVVDARDFPWATWSGSLNLFVWLVVAAYLIWGCRPRYRLLGLAVMPLVTVLLAISYAGGGATGETSRYSSLFLVLHVGLVLIGFAGFTLAAALSALYLWQERRFKRHEATILRIRVPSLVTLDDLAGRTITVALPALTLGIAAGLVRLWFHGGGFDALMGLTLFTWLVYGLFLVLRYEAGWHGRKAAYLLLAGFALVITVRLGLPAAHFS
jgi:ABC-type uncharacterized transport system permease subunit